MSKVRRGGRKSGDKMAERINGEYLSSFERGAWEKREEGKENH